MKLRSIEIRELPGIREPYRVEGLADGVTIITGPNAVGKSSLLRAVEAVVARRYAADDIRVAVTFEDSEQALHWRGERRGTTVEWFRNGVPSEPPSLPITEDLGSWLLRVEDLVQGKHGNAFEREVARRLSGGIEFEQVLDAVKVSASPARSEKRAWQEASRDVEHLQRRYEELAADEARLPQLRQEAARLHEQANRRERIRAAQESLALHRDIAQRRSQLESLPDNLDAFPPALPERIADTEAHIETLRRDLAQLQEKIAATQQTLEATGFGGRVPSEAERSEWNRLVNEMGELHTAQRDQQRRLAELQARRDRAAHDVGVPPRTGIELSPEQAEMLSRQFRDLDALRQQRIGIDQHLRCLGEPTADAQALDTIRKAVELLEQWLNEAAPDAVRGNWFPGLAGVMAAAAAVFSFQAEAYAAAIAATVATLSSIAAIFQARRRVRSNDRTTIERLYERSGGPTPARWTRDAVQELAARLRRERLRLEQELERAQEATRLLRQREELDQEIEQAQTQLTAALADAGFDPETIDAVIGQSAIQWLHNVAALQQHLREEAGARAELELLENQLLEIRAQLCNLLAPWTAVSTDSSISDLRSTIDDL
ncbi:MAG: hypothetical protein D6761_12485, partial [Candidatus Dadabacteria bacterium]